MIRKTTKSPVVAILCSDLHLSLKQPACRADKDWMAIQRDYLKQLHNIRATHGESSIPILCAGDIFDRWNPPAELISFALDHLPDGMICVPGQHDLPNHQIEEMHRSGYGVLVRSGKITDMSNKYGPVSNFRLHGIPWDAQLHSVRPDPEFMKVALIHKFVWTVETSYPGASEEAHLGTIMKSLKGYDVAIFGDNHKGFLKKLKTGTTVVNCGTFIRRKHDEMFYRPSVGILYADGSVEQIPLETSRDRFHDNAKVREEAELDMRGFIEQLEGLGEHGLNFHQAVREYLAASKLSQEIKSLVLGSLG